MSDAFNPYLKWLGIPLKHQPAHHYRLLGLEPFEQDADVIENAADRQMAHVRTFQTGRNALAAQKLLNELSAAAGCLLDPRRKAKYDETLRAELNRAQAPPLPPPVAGAARTALPARGAIPQAVPAARAAVGAPAHAVHPVIGQPVIGPPTLPAHPPVASPANGSPPHAADAYTASAPVTPVANHAAIVGYYRRRRTPAWLLLGVSLLAASAALTAVYFVLNGLSVEPENTVASGAEGAASGGAAPTNQPVSGGGPGGTTSQDGAVAPETSDGSDPVTQPPADPSTQNPAAQNPATQSPSTTDPMSSPMTTVTSPPSDEPNPAEIAVNTSCAVGELKKGAAYRAGTSLEIRALSPELEGLKFTRWPTQTEGAFAFDIRRAGQAYLLARPEYYDEVLSKLSGGNTVTKTDLFCELNVVLGEPIRCAVYRIDFLAGKFEFDGDLVRPILASETLALSDPKLLAAEEPDSTPPTAPPTADFLTSPAADRHPVPDQAVVAKATAQVNSLYFDSVKTPAERDAAVKKLLADAAAAAGTNADDQYVMLMRGLEEAAAVGDLAQALQAADALGKQFEVDRTELRLDAVTRASKLAAPPPIKATIYAASLPVLEEAVAAERYEEVDRLVTAMLGVVQRVGDRDLHVKLVELRKRAAALDAEQRRFKTAQTTLETTPDDPAANLAVGQYDAFVKRDWQAGLPHLAKGSDAAVSDAAKKDLEDPQDAAGRVALAEAWSALAAGRDDRARASILARALYWYTVAAPQLSGLDQKGAESKIAELQSTIASLGQGAGVGPWRALIVAAADYEFQMYINGEYVLSGRGGQLFSSQRTLKPGDVITVKANNAGGAYGFACTIQFEGAKRYLATGDADSGWRIYQPSSRDAWYTVQGIGDEQDALPATGARHQEILRQTGMRCTSIWSSDSREAFLVLRIR